MLRMYQKDFEIKIIKNYKVGISECGPWPENEGNKSKSRCKVVFFCARAFLPCTRGVIAR